MRHEKFMMEVKKLVPDGSTSGSLESQYLSYVEKHRINLLNYEANLNPDAFPNEIRKRWRKELAFHLLTGIFNP